MTKFLTLSASAAALLASAALTQASAQETRTYDVGSFSAIDIAAGITAEVVIGSAQEVRAEADRGDFDDLRIQVRGDTLEIKRDWRGGWGRKKPQYTVYVTATDLEGIDASSGSSISAEGVTGGDLEIDASSGASVKVAGDCDTLTAEGSSGATIRAKGLECQSVEADASSGASLAVFASKSVDAEASSGASVSVYGEPTNVSADKSSGGSVKIKK